MLNLRQIAGPFSVTGLTLGLAFFCASLTPSLLSREHVV